MLAAVALTLATVVLFRMKRDRFAWVTAMPAAWLVLCTGTAGLQKLFHPDPAIGFLAHAQRFSAALADGRVLAPAKSPADMARVVTNDRIDAALCALFLCVVVAIVLFGIHACHQARTSERPTAREVIPA